MKDVLLGITAGVVLNHAIAIMLGSFISRVIPTTYIQIIAGLLFIMFGLNSLSLDKEEELDSRKSFSPILTVAIAFFIGELGDKTQLATMTLAAEAINPLLVLMGTSLAMVATSSLGIFIGRKVGKKIPELSVKIVSSLVFLTFGILRVISTVNVSPIIIFLSLLSLASIEFILIKRILKSDHRPIKEASQALYEKTNLLKKSLDSICLTKEKCGSCNGIGCLLGYIRFILNQSRKSGVYYDTLIIDTEELVKKNYDKEKVLDALILILKDYDEYTWIKDDDFVVNRVKSTLEVMLFDRKIAAKNIIQYIKAAKAYDINIGNIIEENI